MLCNHNNYLLYEVPDNWVAEEDDEVLSIYKPKGKGAITVSFLTALDRDAVSVPNIGKGAKNFIDQNHVKLDHAMILRTSTSDSGTEKNILSGSGKMPDFYVKFWIIAQYPKIIRITYLSSKRDKSEEKQCEEIVNSFKFVF